LYKVQLTTLHQQSQSITQVIDRVVFIAISLANYFHFFWIQDTSIYLK
jgi:hypothetical protein